MTIGVLRVFLGTAAGFTAFLATWEIVVGYNRTYPGGAMQGDFIDGPVILWYGITFAFLAFCWGIGAMGVGPKARWGWGWGLSFVSSIGAVAHGLYRLQQSPPFGITRTSAGLQAPGVWLTTLFGILFLAYLLFLFGIAVLQERRAGHVF